MCWTVKMATLFLFQGNAVSKSTLQGEKSHTTSSNTICSLSPWGSVSLSGPNDICHVSFLTSHGFKVKDSGDYRAMFGKTKLCPLQAFTKTFYTPMLECLSQHFLTHVPSRMHIPWWICIVNEGGWRGLSGSHLGQGIVFNHFRVLSPFEVIICLNFP